MSQQPSLLDHWHVAAEACELTRTPLGRTVGGKPLAMFRRHDGTPAAIDDRCPHYDYPLSTGRVVGDDIECAFHGLRFDGAGICTHMPGQPNIPARFAVRAYPVAEKSGRIYVWLGDVTKADPALIADVS